MICPCQGAVGGAHVEDAGQGPVEGVAGELGVGLVDDDMAHALRKVLRHPLGAVRAAGLLQQPQQRRRRGDDDVRGGALRRGGARGDDACMEERLRWGDGVCRRAGGERGCRGDNLLAELQVRADDDGAVLEPPGRGCVCGCVDWMEFISLPVCAGRLWAELVRTGAAIGRGTLNCS